MQDSINQVFEADILSLASSGLNSQYILISICTALVVISTAIIFPILNWIIKDKSLVIAIFSDVERIEVNKVIENTKRLNINNLDYKKKWIKKSNGQQDYFWNKILKDQQSDVDKPSILNIQKIKNEAPSEEKKQIKDQEVVVEAEKKEDDDPENNPAEGEKKPDELKLELIEDERKAKRKAALTAIE